LHDYDVIIIGAGIGGLTCGALLAKHGMNVLICEQHDKPGGYCTSYKRGGFTFDVPHIAGGLKDGALAEWVLGHLRVADDIDAVRVDRLARFVYPDAAYDFWTDATRLESELLRCFPRQAGSIRQYLSIQRAVWQEMMRAGRSRRWTESSGRGHAADGFRHIGAYGCRHAADR